MPKITAAMVKACKFRNTMHADGSDKNGRFFINFYTCAEYPKITGSRKVWRRGVPDVVSWAFDGSDMGSLENAVAAYNEANKGDDNGS